MTEGETTVSFSEEQTALASEVLDQLIPARGDFPGAGELGVAQHLEGVAASDPGLGRLLQDGLAAIESASHRTQSAAFADLGDDQRVEVLRAVEAESPQSFAMLVRHAYAGYYSNQQGHRVDGPGGPPAPAAWIRAGPVRSEYCGAHQGTGQDLAGRLDCAI